MTRQKQQPEKIKPADIVPVIGYDGNNIPDHFISAINKAVYKLENGEYYKCYSYINKPGKSNRWQYGYEKVKINGSYHNLHWLLARAFVPGYQYGLVVDHIDNNSTNNDISNLQWIERGENTKKYWDSLSEEEIEAFRAKYKEGVRRAHAEGKYDEHLKKLKKIKSKKSDDSIFLSDEEAQFLKKVYIPRELTESEIEDLNKIFEEEKGE